MSGHDIIVIGASAGGVEALVTLVHTLPANFPGALFVVLHVPAESPSLLADILGRAGQLPACYPKDKARIEHGHIYVAPPDYHLLIEGEHMRLVRGPKENRHRPAIDPLFRSAAGACGPRVVGIVLTGMLDDGTAGLLVIKRNGGIAVVQDPREALYNSMPRSALEHVNVDYCVHLAEMRPLLEKLALAPTLETVHTTPAHLAKEIQAVEMDTFPLDEKELAGRPSSFSCPECGGVLWEIEEDSFLRFRCRIGHALSAESALLAQGELIEQALWSALKTLEEQGSLAGRMAQAAHDRGNMRTAQDLEAQVQHTKDDVLVLRQLLLKPAAP